MKYAENFTVIEPLSQIGRSRLKLDLFAQAYVDCAVWSSTHPDTNGVPLDQCGYGVEDLSPAAIARAVADCSSFSAANSEDIALDLDRAGHDFWLTRNRHGAGFWDGDWPEPAATRLTDAAHRFGEIDLYPGDDGLLYFF